MDGSTGFGWLLLGQQEELREMGRLAAEPWDKPQRKRLPKAEKTGGRAAKPDRRLDCRPVADACCCET
jgi:hypothetical protein